jgi:acetyltransferase-like isoleucine patch superfamily enzyme
MLLFEIVKKIRYSLTADRIGPDVPFTHYKLYFSSSMLRLCKKKFKKFSESSEVRPGAYIVGCSKIEIGERVVIRPLCMFFAESPSLSTSISIEDDVMFGAGVHIYINNHNFDRVDIPIINQGYYPCSGVIIRKGCWIGANAIILPGVTIGENSVVGAGAVVTKSVPPGVVVVGCPARIINRRFQSSSVDV